MLPESAAGSPAPWKSVGFKDPRRNACLYRLFHSVQRRCGAPVPTWLWQYVEGGIGDETALIRPLGRAAVSMLHSSGVASRAMVRSETDMTSPCIGNIRHTVRPLRWLFVCLLLLPGLLPGLVLCFGANGHVAVEVPHSSYPHPTSQSHVPCLDLPLSSVQSNESSLNFLPSLARQGCLSVIGSVLLPLCATIALAGVVLPHALLHTPLRAVFRPVILRI